MVGITPVQFDLFAVAEKVGVVGVCMPLVVVAVEEVEPLSLGCSVLALVAQSPLPETTRCIPAFFSTSATVASSGKRGMPLNFREREYVPCDNPS